jgi:hypothetical protein
MKKGNVQAFEQWHFEIPSSIRHKGNQIYDPARTLEGDGMRGNNLGDHGRLVNSIARRR